MTLHRSLSLCQGLAKHRPLAPRNFLLPSQSGQNLETYLFDIYLKRSRYCVVFLSRYYATKKWTSREQEAILARALLEKEYIVPIKLDATVFPDAIATIGNIPWQDYTPEEIAEALAEKLKEVSHVLSSKEFGLSQFEKG